MRAGNARLRLRDRSAGPSGVSRPAPCALRPSVLRPGPVRTGVSRPTTVPRLPPAAGEPETQAPAPVVSRSAASRDSGGGGGGTEGRGGARCPGMRLSGRAPRPAPAVLPLRGAAPSGPVRSALRLGRWGRRGARGLGGLYLRPEGGESPEGSVTAPGAVCEGRRLRRRRLGAASPPRASTQGARCARAPRQRAPGGRREEGAELRSVGSAERLLSQQPVLGEHAGTLDRGRRGSEYSSWKKAG